jgi:hypothetical protein
MYNSTILLGHLIISYFLQCGFSSRSVASKHQIWRLLASHQQPVTVNIPSLVHTIKIGHAANVVYRLYRPSSNLQASSPEYAFHSATATPTNRQKITRVRGETEATKEGKVKAYGDMLWLFSNF